MTNAKLILPKVLGITGGIGAGKSVVASIFSKMGLPVFDCDAIAKSLYDEDAELRDFIVDTFGESLYSTPDNRLDKKQLAEILFSDAKALLLVEEQVHQRTLKTFLHWHSKQNATWCGIESAILYKVEPLLELCSAVLEVKAPLAVRIERAVKRDHTTSDAIKKRIDAQQHLLYTSYNCPLYRIQNDENTPLLPQVRELYRELLSLKD